MIPENHPQSKSPKYPPSGAVASLLDLAGALSDHYTLIAEQHETAMREAQRHAARYEHQRRQLARAVFGGGNHD